MLLCPKCAGQVEEFRALKPGLALVCPKCAVILGVTDDLTVLPMTAEQIDALPKTSFVQVLENSMRAMAKILHGRNPRKVRN